MKDMVLTVIVPIYNKENLLKQCLDSFAYEEFSGSLEVLAIDDGSTDHSLSIALEYSKKYPKIYRVLQKENGGVGSVMNIGLQQASGKYIREVDADDYIYTNALKEVLDYLKECNTDIVLTAFEDVNEIGEHIKNHYIYGLKYGQSYDLDKITNNLEICIQSLIIRKQLLIENNFSFDETRFYVDMQLVCDSIYYASTCVVLNSILYCYRLNQAEQSVSLENYVKYKTSFSKQVELSLKRFSKAQNDKISEVKINLCKSWACGYSSMLYIIYLMDKKENVSEEIKRFDCTLQEEYPLIYLELGNYILIQKLRDENFKNLEYYKEKLEKTIEKLKNIDKRDVQLGDICSLVLNDNDSIAMYKMQKQRDKFRLYFRLLNHWLMNYQNGVTVEQYLQKEGFHKIAIYGFGQLGERLYQELLDGEVQVLYGIDQKVTSSNSNFPIYTLQDHLEEVDAIIVTVIPSFADIKKSLKKKVKCSIISLEDIIYRS